MCNPRCNPLRLPAYLRPADGLTDSATFEFRAYVFTHGKLIVLLSLDTLQCCYSFGMPESHWRQTYHTLGSQVEPGRDTDPVDLRSSQWSGKDSRNVIMPNNCEQDRSYGAGNRSRSRKRRLFSSVASLDPSRVESVAERTKTFWSISLKLLIVGKSRSLNSGIWTELHLLVVWSVSLSSAQSNHPLAPVEAAHIWSDKCPDSITTKPCSWEPSCDSTVT